MSDRTKTQSCSETEPQGQTPLVSSKGVSGPSQYSTSWQQDQGSVMQYYWTGPAGFSKGPGSDKPRTRGSWPGSVTPPPRCDGPIPRSSRTRTSPPQYSVFLPPPGSGQILLLELNRKLLNKLKDGAFTQGSARLNNRTRLLITRTHQ